MRVPSGDEVAGCRRDKHLAGFSERSDAGSDVNRVCLRLCVSVQFDFAGVQPCRAQSWTRWRTDATAGTEDERPGREVGPFVDPVEDRGKPS